MAAPFVNPNNAEQAGHGAGLWFLNTTCSGAMFISVILTIAHFHHITDISWQDF